MRNTGRATSLALTLCLAMGLPLTACTQEVSGVDPELASQAFPGDVRMAEIAAAIVTGDIERVKQPMSSVDLDAHGDRDVTLLQWAIMVESIEGFEALLDADADPHVAGMDGETAVHFAAASRVPGFLSILVERGADMSVPAARGGHGPVASALLAGGDNVPALIRAGADLDQADDFGNTPLHVAARIGKSRDVLTLLEAGADPAVRNGRGNTFDRYFFDRPDAFVSDAGREGMAKVREWLAEHRAE